MAQRNGFRLLTWLGGHEMAVLLALAGVVAGVWGFALLADEVLEGGTQAFDQKLLLAFRTAILARCSCRSAAGAGSRARYHFAGRHRGADVVTVFRGRVSGPRREEAHGAVRAAGRCSAVWSASTVLKDVFQRPRPDLVPYSVYVSGASFPSGHSMMSAVTYLTLGALLARSHERKAPEGVLSAGGDVSDASRSASPVCIWACTGPPMFWPAGRRARSGRCCAGWWLAGCNRGGHWNQRRNWKRNTQQTTGERRAH